MQIPFVQYDPPASYADAVLADAPNGYWKLAEASGPTAVDSSGNGRNGTYVGTPTYGVSGPISGNTAISVTGGGGYVQVPDNALFDLGNTFTLEIWTKRNATQSAFQFLISKGTGTYALDLYNTNVLDFLSQSVATCVQSTTTLTDTASWHHLAATVVGTLTPTVYIDGVNVSGTPFPQVMADTAVDLFIGIASNLTAPAEGSLAHVAVYPTALSAARIAAHYNASFSTGGEQLSTMKVGKRGATLFS